MKSEPAFRGQFQVAHAKGIQGFHHGDQVLVVFRFIDHGPRVFVIGHSGRINGFEISWLESVICLVDQVFARLMGSSMISQFA